MNFDDFKFRDGKHKITDLNRLTDDDLYALGEAYANHAIQNIKKFDWEIQRRELIKEREKNGKTKE